MLTIKRYQNRKLYNTDTHSYITLWDVLVYKRNGRDFQVIDNKTKIDITTKVLFDAFCNTLSTDLKSSILEQYL